MEADMLQAAGEALLIILDPSRLGLLFLGVCMGLFLGSCRASAVSPEPPAHPVHLRLDPAAAMALLLGFGATNNTSDQISAIVLGAPGRRRPRQQRWTDSR